MFIRLTRYQTASPLLINAAQVTSVAIEDDHVVVCTSDGEEHEVQDDFDDIGKMLLSAARRMRPIVRTD